MLPFAVGMNGSSKKCKVYESLVEPNEDIDDECVPMLKIILQSLKELFRKQYQDVMDMNDEKDEEEKEKMNSVQKHNKFAERVFAYTDYLLKVKPNATHITQEATIMFSLNMTSEWLHSKNEKERKELIKSAKFKEGLIF